MSDDTNSMGLKRKDAERKWEQVQIKAFRLWISSYIEKENLVVNDIEQDLKDGVKLCRFLELATDRKLPRYSKKPAMRINMIENQSIFLNCVQKDMGIRLVGIGAEDLVDGHLKLTLGLLWSLFRRLRIDTIKDDSGKSSEDGLLSWLRKMTEGYPNVNITSFKESFNDGMAFSALIHSMDPEALDFDSLNPDQREKNLSNAFQVAEQKLGIPQLLEPEDLLSGHPDERSVILYTSLFFHAYIADSEKRKLEGQRSSIATKVSDLEAKLATVNDEAEELRRLNKELEEKTRQLQLDLEERSSSATDLDDLVKKLREEIAYLRSKALKDAEFRMLLEDKINVLEALLGDTMAEKGAMSDAQKALLAEIEEMKKRSEELGSDLDSMSEERSKMLTSAEDRERRLSEMEDRKSRMQTELQALRDRVSKEIERRKAKAAEVVRLKAELEKLKTKQIVQSKARIGLDVLKHNLEEHLEDLYAWRDLHETDLKDELQEFDLNTVMKDLSDKSFEDQLKVLDERLQQENNALEKVIRLKDAQAKLNDTVIKAGYLTMKGRKEWRKRWFKLAGGSLTYYEDEEAQEVAGCIKLDQGCDVVRQKAVKEDESSNKKVWPLKVTVGDRKLFVRAASKKERHSWFLVLTSAIAHENYMNGCKSASERPDTRITALFASSKTPCLNLDNRVLSSNAVGALVKGLPGRDEIESISLKNTELDDEKLGQLCDVLDKLQVKAVDVSGNKLNASGERLVTAAKLETATGFSAAGNNFGDAFVAALCAAIASNEGLSKLDLSNNQVGAEGAKSIADTFSAGPVAVPALELSGNPLGDDGASNIAAVFAANKSFTSANLSGCNIGDAGAKAIAEALKENTTLETLDLSNNNISAEGALAIRAMMSANKDLQSVNLSSNAGIVSGDSLSALLAGDGFTVPQLSFARS